MPNLDKCKYFTGEYTDDDIFGHDHYKCLCAKNNNTEVSYLYCATKCKHGILINTKSE